METNPEFMTLDEFLAFEGDTETRYEYVNGKIRAIPRPTLSHQRLVGNLFLHAKEAAAERCEIFIMPGLLIEAGNYVYCPDLIGVCDPDDDDRFASLPCFVIEVLSPGTERIDRREKLTSYLTLLPSVEQYAIVAQDEMRIEVYNRERGPFSPEVLTKPDDILELSCIGLRVALKDVYKRFKLPSLEAREPAQQLPSAQ